MFDDLIVRLEAAVEGSRQLDWEIHLGLGHEHGGIPHYTTSLDAAMTLVPEGWAAEIFIGSDKSSTVDLEWMGDPPYHKCHGISENSGPIAVCTAALRARTANNHT